MQLITAKTILNRKKQRDAWFLDDYTLNPYSGCSFNCTFCYIRGSKYGLNMEEKTSMKQNAAELLDKELARHAKKNRYGFIILSSATDPYLHFEEKEQMTKACLEVIVKHRFPVHILTRSTLVQRDFNVLKQINEAAILPDDLKGRLGGVIITFSFSSVDESTGRAFEPGAPSPLSRLDAMKQASEAGFLTGVSLMPLLPFISDTEGELEKSISAFASNRAQYVMPAGLTLFGNSQADSRILTLRTVEKHFPHLIDNYKEMYGASDFPSQAYSGKVNALINSLLKKYGLRNRILPLTDYG